MGSNRKTKAERLAAEAKRLAELLVASDGSVTTAPGLLADPRLAAARQAWEDLAPRLAALGTLDDLSRVHMAMLSVYIGDFVAATDDILKRGYSVLVKTISGDRMPRENPAVARRDHAAKMIIELGRHFGLTRLDRLALRHRPGALGAGPLFGDNPRAKDKPALPAPVIDADTLDWHRLVGVDRDEPN